MVRMKWIGCWVLLLASCGIPYKYQVFQAHQGDRDIVWIFREGALHRCALYNGQPICVRVAYAEHAPTEQPPSSEPPSTPAPPPSAKDLR